jgi:ABC-type multidrug transport system ATPase subunit
MGTLTVYETILNSALLRLPRDMPLEQKKRRVNETMIELGIMSIADRFIGNTGKRGISGGEKRRVSIACELVTSPGILFLDEPTSGLDAYNAYNVVESLVSLARNYGRTVIMTIHQPRSNIYALFDRLVLLAKGRLIYSGLAKDEAIQHFKNMGYECPLGFNLADYLVDLTMHALKNHDVLDDSQRKTTDYRLNVSSNDQSIESPSRRSIRDEQEESLYSPKQHLLEIFPGSNDGAQASSSNDNHGVKKVSQKGDSPPPTLSPTLPPPRASKFDLLIENFQKSSYSVSIDNFIQEISSSINPDNSIDWQSRYKERSRRASWWTQFNILSARTFKNLIRNPDLLKAQYLITFFIAILCGSLFWKVENNLGGFQNRLGVFFFICALFGFQCLGSIQVSRRSVNCLGVRFRTTDICERESQSIL